MKAVLTATTRLGSVVSADLGLISNVIDRLGE
jgi:hypothetical protein